MLLVSTAERRLHMLLPKDGGAFEVLPSRLDIQDSPILSFTVLKHRYIVCTCMSGRIAVYDAVSGSVIAERRDHSKYVVQVAKYEINDDGEDTDDKGRRIWLATAGWDGKVLVYYATITPDGSFRLDAPIANIPQPSSPEALYFVRNPDTGDLHLIVTRRDSSFLYYYQLPSSASSPSTPLSDLPLTGRQNLAPHSNAWVAFTPSALSPHPTDPTLLAVATSAVPHMKLLIVRLLFPSSIQDSTAPATPLPPNPVSLLSSEEEGGGGGNLTAARQARAALALQDREAAAITIHATTMAPQTQYSTPGLAWRPDGSGVWVNSDDGVVRGIEGSTGRVVGSLEGGHEAGSKVRCLWGGWIEEDGDERGRREVLVSGGFDQRLVVWSPPPPRDA